MIEPTVALTLSGLEVTFLSDALRNGDGVKAIEDEVSCLRPLLVNLASAYRELVEPTGIADGPVTIAVTEAQCWLMRAKVRTGDLAIDGKTNVGVGLLRKLYGAILDLQSGLEGMEVTAYEATLTEQDRADLKAERYTRWIADETSFAEGA